MFSDHRSGPINAHVSLSTLLCGMPQK